MPHHALIFGASGISGWAITNALMSNYPSPGVFDRVTALTNRTLSAEKSMWPGDTDSKVDMKNTSRPKLLKVSDIDLLSGGDPTKLAAQLKSAIPDIHTVSHVYYFAYTMRPNSEEEVSVNKEMISHAISAIESLAGDSLRFVVLPTGTKRYGVHLLADGFPFQPPLKETLGRIPDKQAADEMFYYAQIDMLNQLSDGKAWTWAEMIPDVVVGFVPNNNVYCLAQQLSVYLSLVRDTHPAGTEVPFPGNEKSWRALSNDSSQDIIAHYAIYASLNPERCGGGQGWNTADSAQPRSWSDKWPVICRYFGLVGVGPQEGERRIAKPAEFIAENASVWARMEVQYGLQPGRVAGNDRSFSGFAKFIMEMFDFDRQLDMSAAHDAWGDKKEEVSIEGAWYTAFDRFQKARIIPPVEGIPLGTWKKTGHL